MGALILTVTVSWVYNTVGETGWTTYSGRDAVLQIIQKCAFELAASTVCWQALCCWMQTQITHRHVALRSEELNESIKKLPSSQVWRMNECKNLWITLWTYMSIYYNHKMYMNSQKAATIWLNNCITGLCWVEMFTQLCHGNFKIKLYGKDDLKYLLISLTGLLSVFVMVLFHRLPAQIT